MALKSSELLAKFTALHIWGDETGFEIHAVCSEIKALFELINSKRFDLLIIENELVAVDDYKILKKMMNGKFCGHYALCSVDADFEAARSGIILGIDDYFTIPLDKNAVLSLFARIRNRENSVQSVSISDETVSQLFNMFVARESELTLLLDSLFNSESFDGIIDSTVKSVFGKFDWLDLYVKESDYFFEKCSDSYEHKKRFIGLYETYKALRPKHNNILSIVIEYILYNPESDLRQKVISEEIRINKSYLSTVFVAQTGIRFVDYITTVKLQRGAWLLRNTNLRINEIADRMGYRDVAYFSKMFKKLFGVTPTEFKLPDNYIFEI